MLKENAKQAVKGHCIPPLIPPQAGGELMPDAVQGKPLWFLMHSFFT